MDKIYFINNGQVNANCIKFLSTVIKKYGYSLDMVDNKTDKNELLDSFLLQHYGLELFRDSSGSPCYFKIKDSSKASIFLLTFFN